MPTGARIVVKPINSSRLAWLVLIPLVGVVVGVGAAIYGISASRRAATSQVHTATATAAIAEPPRWNEDGPPLLRDINGDGVDDIVGMVRDLRANDQMHLAAYDGASGKPLWKSPALGGYTEVYQGTTFLAANLVLRSNSGGVLRAFDVSTGAPTWSTPLGEQILTLCTGPTPAEIDVLTRDDKVRRLSLATGAAAGATPAPKGRPSRDDCGKAAPVASSARPQDLTKESRTWKLYTLDGFKIRGAVRHGDVVIVRGEKAAGTSVPMIGRIAPDRTSMIWQAQVAAQHPLTSRSEPVVTAMNDDLVFAVYEASELPAPHVTAFSLADGARRWDVEAPGNSWRPSGIAVNQRGVLLAAGDKLRAFELGTGKPLFTIGPR
jgi:outer membrane protein assembly factor BamB